MKSILLLSAASANHMGMPHMSVEDPIVPGDGNYDFVPGDSNYNFDTDD
jgi:hypothetical protein